MKNCGKLGWLPAAPGLAAVLAMVILPAVGCGPPDNDNDAGDTDGAELLSSEATGLWPGEIIGGMVAAYQGAASYSDSGTLTLRYSTDGRRVEDAVDMSVKLVRPNKLSVRAYRTTVICDGRKFRAKITDEATGDIDGQIVVREAPQRITAADLYVVGPLTDPVLADALTGGMGGVPVQLELLLAEEPLADLLKEASKTKLLEGQQLDGHPCHRVQAETTAGNLVFWIDRQSSVLRRLEYPTDELLQQMGQTGTVSDVSLVADFTDAQLGGTVPDTALAMEVPVTAKRVRFFVVPPQPLPSRLFGKTTGDFSFTDLKGEKLTRADLAGKIAVLVWFQDHPASREGLLRLEKVYQRYRDDQRLAFHAVCVKDTTVSNRWVKNLLDKWGVAVPGVRDLDCHGRDLFQIAGAPTLVVLNARGVVQIVDVGVNPNLESELPAALERLLRGDDLAAEILERFEKEQESYRQQLVAAAGEGPTTVIPLPKEKLAAQSLPQRFPLTQLWTCRDLKAPGNVLAVARDDAPSQIFVHDGWRTVVEIDPQGKVARRHELQLPAGVAISHLRTAVDGQRRRWYVGLETGAQRLYVFDGDWKLKFVYPDERQVHDGISDVQIADMSSDGKLMLGVGFWGLAGVHGVPLDGRRPWRCRAVSSILSVAVSAPDSVGLRQFLIANDRGPIVPINRFGHPYPSKHVASHTLFHLVTARFPEPRSTAYCGLSYDAQGKLVVVGIDAKLDEVWSYAMPVDTYHGQLQVVTSGQLLERPGGQWLVAGRDGSIHVIAHDGGLSDQFHYGEHLTGLAMTRIGSKGVLLVATQKGVDAWLAGRK